MGLGNPFKKLYAFTRPSILRKAGARVVNLTEVRSSVFRIYLVGNVFALNTMRTQCRMLEWLTWVRLASTSFVSPEAFTSFRPHRRPDRFSERSSIVLGPGRPQ